MALKFTLAPRKRELPFEFDLTLSPRQTVALKSSVSVRGLSFTLNRSSYPIAVFPVDISDSVIQGKNRIVFCTTNVSIAIDVSIIVSPDPAVLLKKIKKEQELVPDIDTEGDATDICPITRKEIVDAGRGAECRHTQCFDLGAFLNSGRTNCPICGISLTASDLRYDRNYRRAERMLRNVSVTFDHTADDLTLRSESMSRVAQKSKPKFDQMNSRTTQLEQYAHDLSSAKTRIAKDKASLDNDIHAQSRGIDEDRRELKARIRELADKEQQGATEARSNSHYIKSYRSTITRLEAEISSLEKRSEWANSVIDDAVRNVLMNQLRDGIMECVEGIEMANTQIKETRAAVFLHQKQLIDLSEMMAPIRVRKLVLSSRCDDLQVEDVCAPHRDKLRDALNHTRTSAVSEQKLVIEKSRVEKRIRETQELVEAKRAAKAQIMESLLPLRVDNSAALDAVNLLLEQYRTALKRRQEIAASSAALKHDSISKEIELKVERDTITRDVELVNDQLRLVQDELERQQQEVSVSQAWLANNVVGEDLDITPEMVTEQFVLDEIIGQIQVQRELAVKLERDRAPQEFVSEDFADEFRAKIEARSDKIASGLAVVANQIESANNEIQKLEKAKEKAFRKLTEEQKVVVPPPPSPRAVQFQSRLAQLENTISAQQRKCDKKRAKKERADAELGQLIEKLDLRHNLGLVRTDLCERIERSTNWLVSNIRNEQRKWSDRHARLGVTQSLNDWDGKVLNASINEADDLVVRASIQLTP
jgi:hypothetical protein